MGKTKKSPASAVSDQDLDQLSQLLDHQLAQFSSLTPTEPTAEIPKPRSLRLKKVLADKPYHHGDLYEALLEATLECVTQKGVQGLSLRAIAQAVGVSPAAPYRHFADKQEMIAAVAARGFEKMSLRLAALTESKPLEKLRAQARVYCQFGLEFPDYFALMFGSAIEDKALYPHLAQATDETFMYFLETITAAMKEKKLRKAPPELIALTFWGQIHGFTSLLVNKQLKWDNLGAENPEALLESTLELLMNGLAKT
ncbi:MAG: TetR/AcrR family transcriptional regulator [Candidatus Sericytochromatia bacterium]